MLEHQSPLASLPNGGNSFPGDDAALRVTLSGTGLLLLQSKSESSLQEVLASEIELGLPAPQGARISGDYALLWLNPSEWLLEVPASKTGSIQMALIERIATSLVAVTDMSDAFASFEVSGTRATEAIRSGCSLDLRPHVFPSNRITRTTLADIPIIIWKMGDRERFRLIGDRSFAGHVRDWLMDVTRSQPESSKTPGNSLTAENPAVW